MTIEGSALRVSEQESWRLFAPAVFRELDQPRGRDALAAYMDARRCVDPALCAGAARRGGKADIPRLLRVLRSISAAAETSAEKHVWRRTYRAADGRLRRAIALAARNRYLAATSARLRSHMGDADWVFERALDCPTAESHLSAVVDAVQRGAAGQASDAAGAEIDLIESWAWRRLADLRCHR